MSLFKKTKYNAYAASAPLAEKDNMPNTIVGQIVAGALKGEDIGERVAIGTMIDLVSQARKATFYARAHYIHGTPTGNLSFFEDNAVNLDHTIKQNMPAGAGNIKWFYATSGDPEYLKFIAEEFIQKSWYSNTYHTWDHGVPKPALTWDVGLSRITIPVWDSAANAYKTIANTFRVTEAASGELEIEFYEGTEKFKSTGYVPPWHADGYFARYKKTGAFETSYWSYYPDVGGIPDLDGSLNDLTESKNFKNEFLPVAILMHDQKDFNETEGSDLEKTTNSLLKRFNLDGDLILEQIKEHDLGKLQKWDAYIHFGVPIRAREEGSKRYLYHFFDMLRKETKHTAADYLDYIQTSADGRKQPFTDLTITEGGGGGYHAEYRWSFIDYKDVTTTLADPPKQGKIKMEFVQRVKGGTQAYETGLKKYYPQLTKVKRNNQSNENDYIIMHYHDYKGVVHQLFIMGINMRCMINTRDYGTGKNPRDRYFVAQMFGDDEETGEFIIPVNVGIMGKIPPIMCEKMLAEAMHCTLFLVQKTKAFKGWFKWVVAIVAIAIIILTWQYEWLPAVAALLGAAGTAMYYAAYILISLLYGMFLTMAIAIVDNELFMWAVMIINIYYAAGGISGMKDSLRNHFNSVRGAWSNLVNTPGITSSLSFVNSVSQYINVGWSVYERRALASLERAYERLENDYRDEMEAIEAAWAGMTDVPSWLDPMDLVMRPNSIGIYETPEGFFKRLSNTNPGVIALQFPSTFYDRVLDLPDSPGESNLVMDQFYDMQSMRGV